jgi:hypothetical protein
MYKEIAMQRKVKLIRNIIIFILRPISQKLIFQMLINPQARLKSYVKRLDLCVEIFKMKRLIKNLNLNCKLLKLKIVKIKMQKLSLKIICRIKLV